MRGFVCRDLLLEQCLNRSDVKFFALCRGQECVGREENNPGHPWLVASRQLS